MTEYRGFQYSVWNKHFIKIVNLSVLNDVKHLTSPYPNGERYISVPRPYAQAPELYAKRIIDKCYEHYQYWKEYETNQLFSG